MGDADRLDAEGAHLERLARHRGNELRPPEHLVLREPLAHETERVRRAPHRHVVPAQEVRQRADVVLVPVREDHAADAQVVERGEVGVDHVDADAAVVERDAAVDDDHLAPGLESERVHPDLPEPAERNDANFAQGAVCTTYAPGHDKSDSVPYVMKKGWLRSRTDVFSS